VHGRRPRRSPPPAFAALVATALVAVASASGCGGGGTGGTGGTTHSNTHSATGRQTSKAAGAGAQAARESPAQGAAARGGTTASPVPNASTKVSTHAKVAPAHPVPAAFEPAPGAASDAEIRSELAQMAAVQRKQHELALSAAAANLEDLLPWTQEPKSGNHVSVASVFTDYGLGLACGGVLGRNELGVAHKTAPCGTLITFTYGGRSLTVPVIDRGPYIAGREWDLTGATAAALGFPGLGKIEWALAGP
jgi:rare lipoprotein A (RlpA)-like double-psi beta-barrel protein